MCGITGIFAFNLVGKFNKIHITAATMALERRGPDYQDIYIDDFTGLGHRRLCIIDTSSAAHQPMWDSSGRYCIIFNGEVFNYRELRAELESKGIEFRTQSDTEVLLNLYIAKGAACLKSVSGFFAFCIYDKREQSMFVARDRFGVKPLLYVFDEDKFIFASEMKALLQYGIDREIDFTSLSVYLHLNYIPAPNTIYRSVRKLLPGHYLFVKKGQINQTQWYSVPQHETTAAPGYGDAKKQFAGLLDAAVRRRLVSDVPLGSFLSGGIDSSVVAGIASKYKKDLHTFSIGFRDDLFFDETKYARLVAKHFNTNHTVFSLTNDDLYAHAQSVLDYIDEPFADSSAINVYILSRETRRHATVALSGDGADELLGGYNKHAAFLRLLAPGWKEQLVSAATPLLRTLPASRNGKIPNKIRQLIRFGEGMKLSARDAYWQWAGFTNASTQSLLSESSKTKLRTDEARALQEVLLSDLHDHPSMNDVLKTDMKLILPNDMLVKVDMMSMAHGLEVRSPFLDHELVDFAMSLPASYKIDRKMRKKILQDAFRDFLPAALYNRPKKGFEVPVLRWLRREMKSLVFDQLLSKEFVEEQGIFNYHAVDMLKKQLFSSSPGDAHARIWGLAVFQWWWKKYHRTN